MEQPYFNPRPHKEGDFFVYTVYILVIYFNPRPRKEGDQSTKRKNAKRAYISIHALMKRATSALSVCYVGRQISIHALVKRATPVFANSIDTLRISIHALVKRATSRTPTRQGIKYDFNPRPRKEGDRKNLANMACLAYFNPRPRKEGDQKKTDKR